MIFTSQEVNFLFVMDSQRTALALLSLYDTIHGGPEARGKYSVNTKAGKSKVLSILFCQNVQKLRTVRVHQAKCDQDLYASLQM